MPEHSRKRMARKRGRAAKPDRGLCCQCHLCPRPWQLGLIGLRQGRSPLRAAERVKDAHKWLLLSLSASSLDFAI
jgi:hypothetical protein